MKKTIATLAVVGLLALTGCSSEQQAAESSPVPHAVKLADGRTITCIAWKAGYAGGLSCDWDGAK
ncbi:hypothetical protein [Arthrobacter sp. GMC3]|uniref:hypothetical protein n=1 Tax=Arthrobacter sp. GMC3 TaxID=2058894 RepID=UPI000CE50564|nr:hypothetical protein [Arthrobacter sp. GMC3]